MPEYHLASRLALFPDGACVEEGRLTFGGCDLAALAEQHSTPLYLYDQATLDAAVAAYRGALARHYPGETGLTYAGKAFLCVALAQWAGARGLWLDCTGAGELRIAAAAGLERARILVHGVNKSDADLVAALDQAGTLVVDHRAELERLAALASGRERLPDLWLRLRPGVAVTTHAYTQTGQADSKFGVAPGEVVQVVRRGRELGLPLTGLHFHLGSHLHDPAPLGPALDIVLDLLATLRAEAGWSPQVVCPGGGWGVAYHEDDLPQPSLEAYVAFVAGWLAEGCQRRGLPLPCLYLEPGRSLVARAGVALYRVGAVKRTATRRWLLLDGGLADNPRPALYGARYSALPVVAPDRPGVGPAWLAGPYCESGDVLIEALPLPDMQPGELIAVPVSGAYQLSMASNYNGACRPAVLWLADGVAYLARERETADDLIRRDRPLAML
ncbi:MAG: diaminopimelate decarboxylase [Anaerolineae bacterium]